MPQNGRHTFPETRFCNCNKLFLLWYVIIISVVLHTGHIVTRTGYPYSTITLTLSLSITLTLTDAVHYSEVWTVHDLTVSSNSANTPTSLCFVPKMHTPQCNWQQTTTYTNSYLMMMKYLQCSPRLTVMFLRFKRTIHLQNGGTSLVTFGHMNSVLYKHCTVTLVQTCTNNNFLSSVSLLLGPSPVQAPGL